MHRIGSTLMAVTAAVLLAGATAHAAPPTDSAAAEVGYALSRASEAPADENGVPREQCGPHIDGKHVDTYDADGGKHRFVCQLTNNLFGKDRWEWLEIMLM